VEYGTGRTTLSVTVADFDGDGDLDLGVVNGGQNSVSVLRNCRDTGIVFCAGDGSGAACPCNNSSPLGSDSGCLDSHGVGAALRASGSARLAHDGAILHGSNLPDGFALYFQGSARENGGAGSSYGDGLRCVGGTLRRLGAAVSAGGASQFPRAGDPTLSTSGGVITPGTRTYQILYRDRASFCTPDTFNLSNGVQILWTP
jgi:hypothetical protein